MPELPQDEAARERFRSEFHRNFAVSANAGSGKTTAISQRLARMAMSSEGRDLLPRTVVVTFTKKAAAEIQQRARSVLWRELAERGGDMRAVDQLDRAFFGTIHSFCLLLAQRHGAELGVNLAPSVIESDDEARWEEFIEQDAMTFASVSTEQMEVFLRFTPLDSIFPLAHQFSTDAARKFLRGPKPGTAPEPNLQALSKIRLAKTSRVGEAGLRKNQALAEAWVAIIQNGKGYVPFPKPQGTAAGIDDLFQELFAPLKRWLSQVGAILAAELAERYRAWRRDRGVQTYPDQIEAALAVLRNPTALEQIRGEDYRIILDEAQDTDPEQFSVLVELARPTGAPLGTWPGRGEPPRAGHFSLVGDGQQSIYGGRADLRNFLRHVETFSRGEGGEELRFNVTFRTPVRVTEFLNAGFPTAFGPQREYNLGLAPAENVSALLLQVQYIPLVTGERNEVGAATRFPLVSPAAKLKVEERLKEEVRQIAHYLLRVGPDALGVRRWGDVCILAPRNDWLLTAQKVLQEAGLKASLQMRKNRNGDMPVYAWITGLLAALSDPENTFEWVGVLREIFGVSDAQIAEVLRGQKERKFLWDEPERYPEPLQGALRSLAPFIGRVDEEGVCLGVFAAELASVCRLEERATAVDSQGGLSAELNRQLARAADLGTEGGGPREWLRELLEELDGGRPSGHVADDAINLMTCHSAKGLEWPVVIPIGLWREIGERPDHGFKLVGVAGGNMEVFFDEKSMPEDTLVARERERLRELARLMYVTFTRAKRHLVLPWHSHFADKRGDASFAALWGQDGLVEGLLETQSALWPSEIEVMPMPTMALTIEAESRAGANEGLHAPSLPKRVLPHQLAGKSDAVRSARHESALDEPVWSKASEDPIDYGLWWHETMEFVPWSGKEASVENHLQLAKAAAEKMGFGRRAADELAKLKTSELWRELRDGRYQILTELSVFAKLTTEAWMDGVIDLVAHEPGSNTVLIVDWKTNRQRLGESNEALIERLRSEYAPQLTAYGSSMDNFFPGARVKMGVFSTMVGTFTEVESALHHTT